MLDWPAGQVAGWFLLLHGVRRFVIRFLFWLFVVRYSLHPPAFSFPLVSLILFFGFLFRPPFAAAVRNGQRVNQRRPRSRCPTFVHVRSHSLASPFTCRPPKVPTIAIVQHGANERRDGDAARQMGRSRLEIHRVGKSLVAAVVAVGFVLVATSVQWLLFGGKNRSIFHAFFTLLRPGRGKCPRPIVVVVVVTVVVVVVVVVAAVVDLKVT